MRPGDTAVVIVATLISARLAQPVGLGLMDVALVAIANGFLCAASMAFNDWHDVREDAINEPTRRILSTCCGWSGFRAVGDRNCSGSRSRTPFFEGTLTQQSIVG